MLRSNEASCKNNLYGLLYEIIDGFNLYHFDLLLLLYYSYVKLTVSIKIYKICIIVRSTYDKHAYKHADYTKVVYFKPHIKTTSCFLTKPRNAHFNILYLFILLWCVRGFARHIYSETKLNLV